jgi:hypothetical protein
MFFAPSQIEKRQAEWGRGVVETKLGEAWGPFLVLVGGQVTIEHGHGPDDLARVYDEVLEGRTPPDTAYVVHP